VEGTEAVEVLRAGFLSGRIPDDLTMSACSLTCWPKSEAMERGVPDTGYSDQPMKGRRRTGWVKSGSSTLAGEIPLVGSGGADGT